MKLRKRDLDKGSGIFGLGAGFLEIGKGLEEVFDVAERKQGAVTEAVSGCIGENLQTGQEDGTGNAAQAANGLHIVVHINLFFYV